MTYQRDPGPRRRRDYLRRDDGSWSPVAVIGGVAAIVVVGLFLFSMSSGEQAGDPVTPRSPGATAPATVPAPATPKQQ